MKQAATCVPSLPNAMAMIWGGGPHDHYTESRAILILEAIVIWHKITVFADQRRLLRHYGDSN